MLCLCVVAFDRSVCPYDVLGVLNSEVRVDVDVDEPGDNVDTAFEEVVVVGRVLVLGSSGTSISRQNKTPFPR